MTPRLRAGSRCLAGMPPDDSPTSDPYHAAIPAGKRMCGEYLWVNTCSPPSLLSINRGAIVYEIGREKRNLPNTYSIWQP
jgi:hypothetical protein